MSYQRRLGRISALFPKESSTTWLTIVDKSFWEPAFIAHRKRLAKPHQGERSWSQEVGFRASAVGATALVTAKVTPRS
ncbi:uncharacterized protein METZ01_LOCUS381321, partial [marine metagenome]